MKKESKKEIKWKVFTAISITGTAIFGTLYYVQCKNVKEAKEDIKLVKQVVGGPLIDRLIRNEEIKLSKTNNKINNILQNEMRKVTETVLEELKFKKQSIMETIYDFVQVRETLKK